MNFFIEQIAICPPDPLAARTLLEQMGAVDWACDEVTAHGEVYGEPVDKSVADLAFNYQMTRGLPVGKAGDVIVNPPKPIEFEILHYKEGDNWMEHHPHSVSHLGMHCAESDLAKWTEFFKVRGIRVAQCVDTINHTNPVIRGQRWYTYKIFATRHILGVDCKFIVRREHP